MKREPRPYQTKIIDETREALKSAGSVLIQLPTGGGKTVIASTIALGTQARGLRMWFLCHRDFLLDQTSATLAEAGVDHGFIAAGRPFNPHAMTVVCSIDTLRNRLDILPPEMRPKLIVTDEAHHAASATWRRILTWAGDAKSIGLTATPCRLDGKPLGDLYEAMVCGPSPRWLIENGYLSPFRAYCPAPPDMTGLHMRGGDLAIDEMAELFDRGAIIGDMVQHYRRHAMGMRSVYFAVNKQHSRNIAATFTAGGLPFEHLDADSHPVERRAICRALARGDILGISNVALFGEGFDLAAQADMDVSVDCVGLARKTMSLGLFMQWVGRALRRSTGKTHAVVLDHGGNLLEHGFPDEPRDWSLTEGVQKKRGAGLGIKHCPACLLAVPAHVRRCDCGHVWTAEEGVGRADPEHVDGDLREMSREEIAALRAAEKARQEAEKKARRIEEATTTSVEDLIKLAIARGYKNPEKWAAFKASSRNAKADARARAQFDFYKRW